MEPGCGEGDRAIPVRDACPDLLRAASLALGMVGTANEQAVGHGLPLIVVPGAGDQGKACVRMTQLWNGPAALHLPRDAQAIADAIRAFCCRTAFRNLGSDRRFEDREVHADDWTRYYTDHRPQQASVIEPGGKVIGYVFGCSDHARYHRVMARRIVPSCLVRALWRRATGQYRKPATPRLSAPHDLSARARGAANRHPALPCALPLQHPAPRLWLGAHYPAYAGLS